MPKQKQFIALALLTPMVIAGCLRLNTPEPPGVAGVFKTFDHGETWAQKNRFLHSGGTSTIEGTSIINLQFDPQDPQAIYATTRDDGILFSYDSGESWQQTRGIRTGLVESLAIDYDNKCILYVTQKNTVAKTVDCGRTWNEIFIDTVSTKLLTALAINPSNTLVIYTGNSAGDIVRSLDGGSTWRVINRVNNQIMQILIDPADPNIIYIPTKKKGIFKSIDGGENWIDINDGLKPYSASLEYKHLLFMPDISNGLLYASKYGLLFTLDGGTTWTPIELLTPVASTDIFAVTTNPKNSNEIYYATASTFYKTVDGGQNWVTRRLPSRSTAGYLLIDPNSPNIMYLGMNKPKSK